MKFLVVSVLAFLALPAFAKSNVVGTIGSQGDLTIDVIDDPTSAKPYEAALIWAAMDGQSSRKTIQTKLITINCDTLVTEPIHDRFGSCKITVNHEKLMHNTFGGTGYYGVMLTGELAYPVLKGFQGGTHTDNPITINLKLANGNFYITIVPSQKTFALRIDDSLVN